MEDQYIIEEHQREQAATRHLLELDPINEHLLLSLGLNQFFWAIMEIQVNRLNPDVIGELDILVGRLQWTNPDNFEKELRKQTAQWLGTHPTIPKMVAAKAIAEQGGIRWPPSTEYLVGIEVKCAYNEQGTIKSGKASPSKVEGVRKQLARDLRLSFDRVALVDIIAHHPIHGSDGLAWIAAGMQAEASIAAMKSTLAARLANPLPDRRFTAEPSLSTVGHFVWSIGSVSGGNEMKRGAGAPRLLHQAKPNPPGERANLEQRIQELLAAVPVPRRWPVLLRDCTQCRCIHALNKQCGTPR